MCRILTRNAERYRYKVVQLSQNELMENYVFSTHVFHPRECYTPIILQIANVDDVIMAQDIVSWQCTALMSTIASVIFGGELTDGRETRGMRKRNRR